MSSKVMQTFTLRACKRLFEAVGSIGKLNLNCRRCVSEARGLPSHLDEKTYELISLALAFAVGADDCIAAHTAAARKRGATKEQLVDVLAIVHDDLFLCEAPYTPLELGQEARKIHLLRALAADFRQNR